MPLAGNFSRTSYCRTHFWSSHPQQPASSSHLSTTGCPVACPHGSWRQWANCSIPCSVPEFFRLRSTLDGSSTSFLFLCGCFHSDDSTIPRFSQWGGPCVGAELLTSFGCVWTGVLVWVCSFAKKPWDYSAWLEGFMWQAMSIHENWTPPRQTCMYKWLSVAWHSASLDTAAVSRNYLKEVLFFHHQCLSNNGLIIVYVAFHCIKHFECHLKYRSIYIGHTQLQSHLTEGPWEHRRTLACMEHSGTNLYGFWEVTAEATSCSF